MRFCRIVVGFYLFVFVYGKIKDSKPFVKLGRNAKLINSGDTNGKESLL